MIQELHIKAPDTIIDKSWCSAFFATEVHDLLRNEGVGDPIITGVLTNCCRETTARDAPMRDYRVFFMRDATATVIEDLHIASLKNLAFGFAYILNTKDILENIKNELK